MNFDFFRPLAYFGCEVDDYTKLGAYRTNRFEVIQFLVNFSFSSAAILDFEKRMAVLTLPVSGLCHVEALCQIWRESD